MENIPVKIITIEQAAKLGLTKSSGGGSGGMMFGLIASGKAGKKKAEKVEVVNIKTGEKQVLFDKRIESKNRSVRD